MQSKKINTYGWYVAFVLLIGFTFSFIDRQVLKSQDFDEIDLYKNELKKMATKFSLTDIVEIVHKFTKINKNKIYKWLLKLKK